MSLPIDRLITRPRELVPTAGVGSVGATSADAALGSFSVSMACSPGVTGWISVFMAAPVGMCGTHALLVKSTRAKAVRPPNGGGQDFYLTPSVRRGAKPALDCQRVSGESLEAISVLISGLRSSSEIPASASAPTERAGAGLHRPWPAGRRQS